MAKRTNIELLQAALTALEVYSHRDPDTLPIVNEIRARLAKPPKLEPRAWVASESSDGKDDALYWNSRDAEEDGYALIEPLYSYPRQPVRLSDEEILAIAEKYGTSSTRHQRTYHLHDGSPTGETYPITDWDIGQEDLLGFARELLDKNQ